MPDRKAANKARRQQRRRAHAKAIHTTGYQSPARRDRQRIQDAQRQPDLARLAALMGL